MIRIDFLANNLDSLPTLAKWFRDQWPDYYADISQGEIEQGFLEETSHDRLPIRLIAFESNELAGTIILREHGSVKLPVFQPELGGLYVVESHRGHGIGAVLVRAGMKLALNQGYETVYETTVNATGFLERLGWKFIKTIIHKDELLELYQCDL